MARMSIDDMFLRDPRVLRLSITLGWTKYEARGRLLDVFALVYDRVDAGADEVLDPVDIDIASDFPGLAEQLIAHDLAVRMRNGVRIKGATERTKYLATREESGRLGGIKSGETRRNKAKVKPKVETKVETKVTFEKNEGPSNPSVPDPRSYSSVGVPDLPPDPQPTPDRTEPDRPELPGKIPSLDAEQNARYQLVTEIWNRLAAVRTDLAAELGETTRPLAPFDRGKAELAARIREIGNLERARADCEHVLAVRVDEARAKRELKWLTGAIFGVDSMRAALGSSRQEAKRAKPSSGADDRGLMRPKLPWAVDS
jgi:hypothetical protein